MDEEKNTKQCEEKANLNANTRVVPDGGWGWAISIAAFTVQFVILGLQNHLGLIHREHMEHFGESNVKTGWVSSLALGNMFLFAPLTSALCEKFGCRRVGFCGGILTVVGMLASSFAPNLYTLYFTFGIVYGIGTSMCYFPTLRTLPYWFSRNLALANGIAAAGSGVGTVAMGPLLQVLLSATGWRNTLRIFAGLLLIPTLAALAYCLPENRNKKEKEANLPKPNIKIVDFTVLQNPAFIILCVAMSTFMLGYFVPFIHLPRYAQELNIADGKASNLIGIMSVGSTFGRLFFGKLSDHPRVNRLYLYQMSFFCIGAVQALVPQITNFTGFAMYMVSFGVFDGCFIVLLAIVVSDVVGIDRVSTGMGVKFFFMAITTFVGPPLAGWLVDISGSYDLAFYAASGSAVLACLLLFLVPICMPRGELLRHTIVYDIGVEETAEDEYNIYDKKYPFGGYPEINIEDSGDPTSTDSSLLSPPAVAAPKSLLSVHSINSIHSVHSVRSNKLKAPRSTLSVHSREAPLRASWLAVSCAVAGGDPHLLPPEVVHRAKSTPHLHVLDRMTTV